MKNSTFILSSISLCFLGLGVPQIVAAQNTETDTLRNTPVTLNVEEATLYSALKTLFAQAKADFTITASLKTFPVTVHLNQPFRIALESVLRATGQPITYTVENGVYYIEELKSSTLDDPPVFEEEPLPPKRKPLMYKFHVRNGSGLEIAAMLGIKFVPWTVSFFPPYIGSNPFAPVNVSGGGAGFGGGQGNNNAGTGGGAAGFANGASGVLALPGLGLGFFGNGSDPGSGGSGKGGG